MLGNLPNCSMCLNETRNLSGEQRLALGLIKNALSDLSGEPTPEWGDNSRRTQLRERTLLFVEAWQWVEANSDRPGGVYWARDALGIGDDTLSGVFRRLIHSTAIRGVETLHGFARLYALPMDTSLIAPILTSIESYKHR